MIARIRRLLSAAEAALRSVELVNTSTHNAIERSRVRENEAIRKLDSFDKEIKELRALMYVSKERLSKLESAQRQGKE